MLGMTATPDRTDRKDIFELFDYNKIYEVPLAEAIERGFLVPYTYYGLTDNVDYSRIRFENQRYRVDDLERLLIIPERNEAILREYLDKGEGDKAIGFCVSINHAERMAEYFNQHGVTAAAIHSQSPTRDEDLTAFRENKTQVAFTVDLFNEGMDFPNVRVLLFLRPTESKTVFVQQLGRGLRLYAGKDRVRVLDFIGNYKRAHDLSGVRGQTVVGARSHVSLLHHFVGRILNAYLVIAWRVKPFQSARAKPSPKGVWDNRRSANNWENNRTIFFMLNIPFESSRYLG